MGEGVDKGEMQRPPLSPGCRPGLLQVIREERKWVPG